jgi:hypothetical protein
VTAPDPVSVVAIVAAYNEADIIAQTVGDLIHQGVQVYVLDHGSTDGTVAALAPYRGQGLLGVEPFSGADGFAWEAILRRKETLARELAADWFIHHDADEFRESPWPHLDLRAAIARVDALGYNAIDFAVLEFPPTHDDFQPWQDVREAFRFCEWGQPWDRVQIRCWKRAAGVDLASSGGHEAVFPGRRVFPVRFLLRHYPIRGQAHGERKVFRERRPRFVDAERRRGWHVHYDAIEPGHRFVRDARTLMAYDPDAIRMPLLLRHRGVEELEAALVAARERGEALQVEVAERDRDLARQREEGEALRRDLTAAAAGLTAVRAEGSALRVELARRGAHAGGLQARVDALEASRSWRWTAPLRAAFRLLGGR